MSTPDNVNTPSVAVIGGLGTLILVVVVIGLQALFFQARQAQEEAEHNAGLSPVYTDSAKAQKAAFDDYRKYSVEGKEYIAIPIQEAMKLEVAAQVKAQEAAGKGGGGGK